MNKPGLLKKNFLFFAGLLMLAAGLPVSRFLTSFSQIVLLASFFIEGDLGEKWKRLRVNRCAWILAGIWFLHLAGLLYTDRMDTAAWDLRMKLPLLVLPLVIGAAPPVSSRMLRSILWTFTGAVLTGTLVSSAVLAGILHYPVDDIRDIFIFHISHIRFALFTCLAFYFMGMRALAAWPPGPQRGNRKGGVPSTRIEKVTALILMPWFVIFLVLAESVTGLAILLALSVPALLALAVIRRSLAGKIAVIAVAILIPVILGMQAYFFLREINTVHPETIDTTRKTALGNAYAFIPQDSSTENGYRTWLYFNMDEMRSAWNKRSVLPFDSLDKRAQPLKMTLVRYLTSLGWKKDAESVAKLSAEDVQAVESGIANVHYLGTSNFKARLLELNWEYHQAKNQRSPDGHSVAMRIEFWKAGWEILKNNFWTGVGTGDLQQAYDRQYDEMQSRLSEPWRHRAHNQYLSIFLAFGVLGFAYFIFALIYPAIRLRKTGNFLYMIFLGIILLSMLTEDTLETPAGSSFFALFNALLLFSEKEE